MATLGAHSVGHAGLTAIRTKGSLGCAQRIVRAALVATSLGMSSFWIWHNYSVNLSICVLKTLECSPTRIDVLGRAITVAGVQVDAAFRADSLAVFPAQRSRRRGQ